MSKIKIIVQSEKVLTADFPQALVVFHKASRRPYVLNESAATIWNFCKRPKDVDSIIEYLRRIYGISQTRAEKDVKKILDKMRKAKLLKS